MAPRQAAWRSSNVLRSELECVSHFQKAKVISLNHREFHLHSNPPPRVVADTLHVRFQLHAFGFYYSSVRRHATAKCLGSNSYAVHCLYGSLRRSRSKRSLLLFPPAGSNVLVGRRYCRGFRVYRLFLGLPYEISSTEMVCTKTDSHAPVVSRPRGQH
jgi:hypothetical protein